jgi:hypothetical protein
MYNDLLEIDAILTSDKMGTANLSNGAVGRVLGFDIYIRSTAVVYTNAATPVPKTPGAAGAVTDNLAALFWHPMFVRKAMGDVRVYVNEGEAAYYGDILSAEARAGGRKSRTGGEGVVALVETAS